MRYLKIDTCDLNNGDGARITLWVSGCGFRCYGCHNKESWDFNNGELYTNETEQYIIELLKSPFINGLSILGGEPLAHQNYNTIISLCERVKNIFKKEKDIWLWTGFKIEALNQKEIKVDYLIDGQYDYTKPTTKKWRGSDNQILWHKNWEKNLFEKIS